MYLAIEFGLLALAWREVDKHGRVWTCVVLLFAAFTLALATVPPDTGLPHPTTTTEDPR